MPRDSTVTREKLIRAAEHLFARHGFDVPIRDIQERAGQRNATALQYHFGGKKELIMAIIERHAPSDDEVQAIRDDLAAKQDEPRELVEAIVRRVAARLATPEGRDFLRLSFQLLSVAPVRRTMIENADYPQAMSVPAETALIRACVPGLPERLVRERALAGLSFIMLQMSDRARLIDDSEGADLVDEEDFIVNLVDMTTAALTAPASATPKRRKTSKAS